jgi:hypothetical protein
MNRALNVRAATLSLSFVSSSLMRLPMKACATTCILFLLLFSSILSTEDNPGLTQYYLSLVARVDVKILA